MWCWHNRRCVWDKVASEWAGEEEWSIDKEKYQAIEDKRDFITFYTAGCQNIQLCTGRKLETRNGKLNVKHQEQWALLMYPSTLAKKEQRFKCVETATLLKSGSMVIMLWGKRKMGNWPYSEKRCTRGRRKRSHSPSPRSTIM